MDAQKQATFHVKRNCPKFLKQTVQQRIVHHSLCLTGVRAHRHVLQAFQIKKSKHCERQEGIWMPFTGCLGREAAECPVVRARC
ncbi:hypothetical protein VULLAG_LOCUS4960 [Vulpes lagopus]